MTGTVSEGVVCELGPEKPVAFCKSENNSTYTLTAATLLSTYRVLETVVNKLSVYPWVRYYLAFVHEVAKAQRG